MLESLVRTDRFSGPDLDDGVSDDEKRGIEGWLTIAERVADDFEWRAVHDRIAETRRKLARGFLSQRDLGTELRVLRETIHFGLKNQLIYRYPQAKADVLGNWRQTWEPVLKAFPASQQDIWAGVDLWAMGHATASVFHFMRVLEHGLRALASDVGRRFDVQNWQNIIDEIEAEIRQSGKTLPRGEAKNERLQFLSAAAKEFIYFKDGWRNYVSHSRGLYDGHQAHSVMDHVQAFMLTLSTRLSEAADDEEQPC